MKNEMKEFFGRVSGINTNDNMINIMVKDGDEIVNVKADIALRDNITINAPYYFKIKIQENLVRDTAYLLEMTEINNCNIDYYEKDKIFRRFYQGSKYSLEFLEKKIFEFIDLIENNIIKTITSNLVKKYKEDFFLFPAATRLHHAYVGGLAEHSFGMLLIAKDFTKLYPNVDSDYLFSGVILHDLGKIKEFSGVENTNYTIDGQLLGHLVIGSQMVYEESIRLNVSDSIEARLLQHMIISHHGQQAFGSAKRPMTAEALLLWYIDTIDSKMIVLDEELSKVNVGEMTEGISVLDRGRFYKHKETTNNKN